jgi:8-oxo-dGTP pyrophosphatase MutT (NUDIX family)
MTCLASGIILYRRSGDGVRLLVLRNRDAGHWGFAKGRRDAGDEHEVRTALREVAEETGFRVERLHAGFRRVLEYRTRPPVGEPYDKRVVYFLAEAPAGEPRLSPEHAEARWAAAAELDALLRHEQLRAVARAALDALARP